MNTDTPTRRCWRCLQMFPCSAADVPAGRTEWWLCAACHTTLLGDGRTVRTVD